MARGKSQPDLIFQRMHTEGLIAQLMGGPSGDRCAWPRPVHRRGLGVKLEPGGGGAQAEGWGPWLLQQEGPLPGSEGMAGG